VATATTRRPTASGISRLLAKAGYQRSTYGQPSVMWNEATDGFSVWKTHHRDNPQQPYVAVQYHARTLTNEMAEWRDIKAEMLTRLGEYATVIEKAGYHPLVRDRGDEPPWLTILTAVPAPEDSEGG
jgi:hypothetical protein